MELAGPFLTLSRTKLVLIHHSCEGELSPTVVEENENQVIFERHQRDLKGRDKGERGGQKRIKASKLLSNRCEKELLY